MLGPKSTTGLQEVFAMLYFLGKKGGAKRPEICKFIDWYRTTQPLPEGADGPAAPVGKSTISRQLTTVKQLFGIRLSQAKLFGVSIVHWGFINKELFFKAMEERVDLAAYDKFCAEN